MVSSEMFPNLLSLRLGEPGVLVRHFKTSGWHVFAIKDQYFVTNQKRFVTITELTYDLPRIKGEGTWPIRMPGPELQTRKTTLEIKAESARLESVQQTGN